MQYKHLLVFRHELVNKVKNKNQNNYSRLEMIQWKYEASLIVKTAVISENKWPPSMEKHWQLVQVNSYQDKPQCFYCHTFLWKQLCRCLQFLLQYSPVCETALHLKWAQSCSRKMASLGETVKVNVATTLLLPHSRERLPARGSGVEFAQHSPQQHCWWEYKHKD